MLRKLLRSPKTWTVVGLVVSSSALLAQRYGQMAYEPKIDKPQYDGRFIFTRGKYTVAQGGYYYHGMPSWAHGLPLSEDNLMRIVDAISTVGPRTDASNVVGFDDPELMKFPIVYATETSFWITNDKEAANLREYLTKGGFMIFDDFRNDYYRGSGGWGQFETNMRRVFPDLQVFEMDIKHPIFHCFFDIDSFDTIPQDYDSGRPIIRGIFENNDPSKRLMAIINFNTDVSNWWEFAGQGFRPVDDTNQAYKLGVNYIIYGLTH
jgi:hypothetical protein